MRNIDKKDSRYNSIGSSVPRKEDDRLLRGDGKFTDDVQILHQLEMAVGRSPFPHAIIQSLDINSALELDGVHHILTGLDVRKMSKPLTVLRPVPGAPDLPYYALAMDKVIHEGQPVVSVVAKNRAIAEDAIELIDIEYEPIAHITETHNALAKNAPIVHPESLNSNLLTSNEDRAGNPEEKIGTADKVIEGRFYINRVTALPMESRGIVVNWRSRRA